MSQIRAGADAEGGPRAQGVDYASEVAADHPDTAVGLIASEVTEAIAGLTQPETREFAAEYLLGLLTELVRITSDDNREMGHIHALCEIGRSALDAAGFAERLNGLPPFSACAATCSTPHLCQRIGPSLVANEFPKAVEAFDEFNNTKATRDDERRQAVAVMSARIIRSVRTSVDRATIDLNDPAEQVS